MKIEIAKTAGFCPGVNAAITTAYEKTNVCTLGPIIHNKFVTNELEQRGVHVINSLEEADGRTVLIRTHGVPPNIYAQLNSLGIDYIDCTCPFVKKIHKLVQDNYLSGKKIIIVGDKNHPEVIGINGYANDSAVIIDSTDIDFSNLNADYILVAQTTFDYDLFKTITKMLNGAKVFDTVCNTTKSRQTEAFEISTRVNKMIVLGDKFSSNTTKLFAICKRNCPQTYLIETLRELSLIKFLKDDTIGVTAGASTPFALIKEAISFMNQEKTFEELLNESFISLRPGDIVKGIVVSISRNEVIVDIGYKSDGIISQYNFSDDNTPLNEQIKLGDEIESVITKIDDGEGHVLLSKRKLDLKRGFKMLEQAMNDKTKIMGKVIGEVKGGVMIIVNGVKLFVPASHLADRYVENLSEYVGKSFDFNIIEMNKEKRRYIASRKNTISLGNYTIGQDLEGTVSNVVKFGVFVDIGGVDGLVHSSEIPSDMKLSIGDKLNVTIINVDSGRNRISLAVSGNLSPWNTATDKYKVGEQINGKVVRINKYGAFVELEPKVEGLLHISEISDDFVDNVTDKLQVGDELTVKILSVDMPNKRISLSMK